MSVAVSALLGPQWAASEMVAVGREAEALGFDGLWISDHFMESISRRPVRECFTTLAGLAIALPRVRFGSLVASIPHRHPAVLANMAATISDLSGGRLVLGIGAGWNRAEHTAYGIPLGQVRERIDRPKEGLAVLDSLLRTPHTTVKGSYYSVTDAQTVPVQSRVPVLVGAKGEDRMLGGVARWADEWNCWSTPEVFAYKSAVLDDHCARIDRDRRSVRRTTQAILDIDGTLGEDPGKLISIGGSVAQIVDTIGQWQDARLDEFIVPAMRGGADEARELLGRFATEIRPQLD